MHPALKRAGARLDGGQKQNGTVQNLQRVSIRAGSFVPLHHQIKLAPAHEAGRRHRATQRVDIDQRVAGRIERYVPAPNAERNHPGAGGDDGESPLPDQKMRIERSVAVMDAAGNRKPLRQTGPFRHIRQQRAQHVTSLAHRRHAALKAKP